MGWTYGAEHELADWPALLLSQKLPSFGRDQQDITCVNSNGIANDPKLKYYTYGGEINTPPTDSIEGQGDCLNAIIWAFPEAKINYRSNLHFHIHVPGLQEDLPQLKRLVLYNQYWLPVILPEIEPIPRPLESLGEARESLQAPEELNVLKGALRRYNRRRKSHHTLVSDGRVELQMLARTTEEFLEAEVPRDRARNKPLWHLGARAAVNLRQLRETDTVEFRHFPGTLDANKLVTVGLWCKTYLQCALSDWQSVRDANPLAEFFSAGGNLDQIPKFEPYDHRLEVRYRATVHDGTLAKETIIQNILAIEGGTFNDEHWNRAYSW